MSRILLVADPAPRRDDLADRLRHGPHTVKAIAPGDLRLEAAREWEPDIIVMELDTEGAALPLRIGMLRDPSLANVPFVAVGESPDEARALGAHAFVRAPAEADSLLHLVAHFSNLRFPLPA